MSGAAASTPRHISSTPAARYAKPFPPRPSPPPENEIEETFLKGSGPGGQKIVCVSVLRRGRPS